MKQQIALILLLFFTSFCYGQTNADTFTLKRTAIETLDIKEEISLINLIANPEKYHGKRILIVGYLHLEFEGNAVYLHKEDNENSLTKNGFWVSFSPSLNKVINPKSYNDRYVMIVGTFDMNFNGHMDLFGGAIRNISWLQESMPWRK